MGRERVSGVAAGPAKRSGRRARPGLKVIDRGGHWHITGTVRVGGRSVRLRRSTELPARKELYDAACDLVRQIEDEVRNEAIYGIRPSRPLGVAAGEYLQLNAAGEPRPGGRGAAMGPSDRRVLAEVIARFGLREIDKIPAQEWNAFLDERHDGNSADTRSRFCNPLISFLVWCADPDRAYLAAVPAIKKRPEGAKASSSWKRAARRQVAELRPDLLVFLFSHAAVHLKAQLYTEWSTGARVSSVLFGCRLEDLVLGKERQQITYRATKNGDDVVAALHPATVEVLREYLAWRGKLQERAEALFLTDDRKPYSDRGRQRGWSGANKTAFNAMKRRAILVLLREAVHARRAGDVEAAIALKADAKLIRQVTQHWLRHWLATHSMAAKMPTKLIMAQQGWRDERSVMRYQHDVEDVRRQMVENLPIGGTSLTRPKEKKA
jgi:site-specific recombinase XerD